MTEIWAIAALWLGLAFIAAPFAVWFRVSTALTEIIVGTIAGFLLTLFVNPNVLGTDRQVPCRLRRHRADVFGRRRARPGRLPQELEGGDGGWLDRLFRTLLRLRCGRVFLTSLGHAAKLAGRRCALHHVSGCRLR